MNDLLNKLSFWLVKQLDKLKMSNPFLYTLVQGVLVLLILGVSFPKNFLSVIKVIFKRLFRVYAHIYHSHF